MLSASMSYCRAISRSPSRTDALVMVSASRDECAPPLDGNGKRYPAPQRRSITAAGALAPTYVGAAAPAAVQQRPCPRGGPPPSGQSDCFRRVNVLSRRSRAGDYRAKKIKAAPSIVSAPKMSNGVAAQLGLDAGSIIVKGRYSLERTFANRREPSPPPRRGRVAKSRRARRRFLRSIDPSPMCCSKLYHHNRRAAGC